jgi:hypothetical protein
MPPKKKGKKGKKKGKEVVPITDPEMLRVIGCPLEGTQLNLRMYYRELGHKISIALKLTDLATVSDMVREFNTITNAPPGSNYVFVGKLRKSHQSTIMLNFDGHLNLKDQLGVQDKDEFTFIEADSRMILIYTKKRMQKQLDLLLGKRSALTGELVLAKKTNPDDVEKLNEMEKEIETLTNEINNYKTYVDDPELGLQKLGTYRLASTEEEDPNAGVPRTFKPFASLPVEEQQRLKILKGEALDIKRTNEDILEAQRLKAEGGGKKGKKGKKKKKK